MTELCRLAVLHGTDKFSKHRYTPIYYRLFKDRVVSVRKVLEIGIKRGASLRMWEGFFPSAVVVGIDSKTKNLFNEGRICSFKADQGLPETLEGVAEEQGPFDLIVDDGSHKLRHQTSSMTTLLPFLKSDGIYVVEDIRSGDLDALRRVVPKEFFHETVLTTDMTDSGLLVVQRC